MSVPFVAQLSDSSQIGEVRRVAMRLGETAGLNAVSQGRLGIVATELATNTLRHAVRGRVLVQATTTVDGEAIDLLALDHGPGIPNLEQAMRDGYSTGGTAGNGLGAMQRLSDQFDIYSQPTQGTAVFSRILREAPERRLTAATTWSGICTPVHGETECGDAWTAVADNVSFVLMVADGLGHGPEAAKASSKGIEVLLQNAGESPGAILQKAHQALTGTRGAAVAVLAFDSAGSIVKYAGIGNISGTLVSPTQKRGLFTHNGTVGSLVRKVQEFTYPFNAGNLIIMHSDGLQTHWSFEPYPGLVTRHPAIIAGVLYRDFERTRDDTTVVVIRIGSAPQQPS